MSESGQIVLIGPGDFLDQAMETQTLEDSRNLSSGFVWQVTIKMLLLKPGDVELAAYDSLKHSLVIIVKEIEATVRPLIIEGGARNLVEITYPLAWVVDGRNKFKVAMVSRGKNMLQRAQAVNGLFHGSPCHGSASVAMFYLTVVFIKGDVIGCGLDSEDETELIVHFDGRWAHMMFDAGSFDARVKVIAHFVLVVAVELASKESGDVVGFHRMDLFSGFLFCFFNSAPKAR